MAKEEVFSFKVDADLAEQLRHIENRSDFIRTAIMEALRLECPFCKGSGVLSPSQMAHIKEFLAHHPLEECEACASQYPSCDCHHSHLHS